MIYNFSNIKAGGGIQVSLSFLNFLSKLNSNSNDILLLSRRLNSSIHKTKINLSSYKIVIVKNLIHKILFLTFHKQDKVFTIFGPTYAFKRKGVKWINGFAQAWILFPRNEVYKEFSLVKRYLLRLKFKIQEFLFSNSDVLIVEHEKIKDLLENIFPKKEIIIAYNSVNEVFKNKKLWNKIDIESKKIKIGILGNSYIHKNLKILPKVKNKLIKDYGLDSDFYVTLNKSEMNKMNKEFKRSVKSLGEISIYKCPNFYIQMDLIFFPSNLECFSATPIESIFMQKKIVCSDYFFNRYFTSEFIDYFEPNDANDAAKKIYYHLKRKVSSESKDKINSIISEYDAKKRFSTMLNCINKN